MNMTDRYQAEIVRYIDDSIETTHMSHKIKRKLIRQVTNMLYAGKWQCDSMLCLVRDTRRGYELVFSARSKNEGGKVSIVRTFNY